MSKRGKLRSYAKVVGKGNDCPKCKEKMERRARKIPPTNKSYFYTEWDYCTRCCHVQHYDEFKSAEWQESEYQDETLKHLLATE